MLLAREFVSFSRLPVWVWLLHRCLSCEALLSDASVIRAVTCVGNALYPGHHERRCRQGMIAPLGVSSGCQTGGLSQCETRI